MRRSRSSAALPGEDWRPLPGRPGGYEVSSFGRVRRPAFEAPRRRGGTQHYRAFALKAYRRNGAPVVQLSVGRGRHRAVRVARLVAEAFLPPAPRGAVLDHLDGDRGDVRPENLRWKAPLRISSALLRRLLRA